MQRLHDAASQRWIGEYVATLRHEMGLRDWEITVHYYPPLDGSEDAHAEIRPTDGQRHAVLKLDADFTLKDRDEQRYILCHELLHCHLDLVQQQGRNDLPQLLGQPAYEIYWGSFVRGVEHAVDAIARHWAPSLPLPPKR